MGADQIEGSDHEDELATVVHFGCGRLGVGAVLPFLVHHYGSKARIVVVQRWSDRWRCVPDGIVVPFSTTAGDFMPFRTIVFDGSEHQTVNRGPEQDEGERRLLVLVPEIGMSLDLLRRLSKASQKKLIISCSLSSGQAELIQLLRIFPDWEKALVFENNASNEWKIHPARWHHIIVDRICWQLEQFSDRNKFIRAHCEGSSNVSFWVPDAAMIPSPVVGAKRWTIAGEHIEADDWKYERFEPKEAEWYKLRKRALINAPHAISAHLCYRLLADRQMDGDKQYLAPLQQMLRSEHPEWEKAMDHYLRLRALQVAWECPRYTKGTDRREFLHAHYATAYGMAKCARTRFFATNDRLDRVMDSTQLAKEFDKWDEHIRNPIAFYETNRGAIRESWVYGRPNHIDMVHLRDFLTESFSKATRLLAAVQH
jgi:hypothetical protein